MASPNLHNWNGMEKAPKTGQFIELILQDTKTKILFGASDLHRWDGFRWRTKSGVDIHPSLKPYGWMHPKKIPG